MSDRSMTRIVWGVAALIALAAYSAAAQPNIVNAKIERMSAAGGLSGALRTIPSAAAPVWAAYAVPMISGGHDLCCNESWNDGPAGFCGECQLEDDHGSSLGPTDRSRPEGELEPGLDLVVFLRIENRLVDNVRIFSADCRVNADGRTVYWLGGVQPADSVAMLTSLATGSGREIENTSDTERVSNGALMAVALQSDPSAERALESFVAAGQAEKLREHAAFWLGSIRGHAGYEILRHLARTDPNDSFRRKIMFDLYVSKDPQAMDTLIEHARNDSSPRVRSQALFWLAQKAGQKAAAAITAAIKNDPDTEVKKRAVFALSQLPKDQGVPLLIQVARSNSNPAVRKAAMFWLGQSKDPRALAFFEQILASR
jgi:HEAT repeats